MTKSAHCGKTNVLIILLLQTECLPIIIISFYFFDGGRLDLVSTLLIRWLYEMKIPSVALLVLGLMALMPFSLAIQKGEPYKGYTFGLVIDAGSSGSRLHVYRWDDRIFHEVPPNLSIPVEIDSFKLSVEPGVDMVEGRTKLQSMINDTQKNLTSRGISKERLATFPLYLKATAGLRVLNQTRREE